MIKKLRNFTEEDNLARWRLVHASSITYEMAFNFMVQIPIYHTKCQWKFHLEFRSNISFQKSNFWIDLQVKYLIKSEVFRLWSATPKYYNTVITLKIVNIVSYLNDFNVLIMYDHVGKVNRGPQFSYKPWSLFDTYTV